MKKTYIQPACNLLGLGTMENILAGSPQYIDNGDRNKELIREDKGNSGWAGAKGDHFNVWEDDEDEE